MKCYALVHPGMEELCQQEIQELLGIPAVLHPTVLEFSVKTKEELLVVAYRAQSVRRVLVAIGKYVSAENIPLPPFPWNDFFTNTLSFKIEVENIPGQETRFALAKTIATALYTALSPWQLTPPLNLKHPDMLVVLYSNGKHYFLGLDVCGIELNSRFYRVFPHQATFKGDLAYYFIRVSGLVPGKKLLVGMVRDGTLAIEAALFSHTLPVQDINNRSFSFFKFPLFQDFNVDDFYKASFPSKDNSVINIHGFDNALPSVMAARKNVSIAKVKSTVSILKHAIDELDLKYNQNELDIVLFHLTAKDECNLNEIIHQSKYVLASSGLLQFITMKALELSAPAGFVSLPLKTISRGDNTYSIWRFQRQ